MILQDALTRLYPHEAKEIKLDVLGTDIDAESVLIGKNGVYPWNEVKEIPLNFLSSNWVRGSGEISNFAKAKAHLRAPCRFEQQNLLSLKLSNEKSFDVIFCRNVFIYFNQIQIQSITSSLLNKLNSDGFLFLGISETLNGLSLPVKTLAPSVYVGLQHPLLMTKSKVNTTAAVTSAEPLKPTVQALHRILVVDDSPSIHTLMKQVFTAEHGFEVVGHAMNGVEASEFLKKNQADALTLDIHMPVQDGVEYLRSSFNAEHPAVVMVSSVSREDSSLAAQALEMGASDYVEKPALNNLKQRADELRTKIRCSIRSRKSAIAIPNLVLDKTFQTLTKIEKPKEKLTFIFMHGSDRGRIRSVLKSMSKLDDPGVILFLDTNIQGAELIKNQLEKDMGVRFKLLDANNPEINPGEVHVAFSGSDTVAAFQSLCAKKQSIFLVLGEVSQEVSQITHSIKNQYQNVGILLEELGEGNKKHLLSDIASEYSPLSGFTYMLAKLFSPK